jgi:hypothetical protein
MDHLHPVQDGRAVVRDGHVTLGILQHTRNALFKEQPTLENPFSYLYHLVHPLGSQTRPDGIGQGLRRLNIRAPNLRGLTIFVLHEPRALVGLDKHHFESVLLKYFKQSENRFTGRRVPQILILDRNFVICK